jgi:acyl carrier protein
MAQSRLTKLLKQQFPNSVFDESDSNLSVGAFPEWDSLAHMNFLMLVEEDFGIRFSMEEMSELKNLKQIDEALAAKGIR